MPSKRQEIEKVQKLLERAFGLLDLEWTSPAVYEGIKKAYAALERAKKSP